MVMAEGNYKVTHFFFNQQDDHFVLLSRYLPPV